MFHQLLLSLHQSQLHESELHFQAQGTGEVKPSPFLTGALQLGLAAAAGIPLLGEALTWLHRMMMRSVQAAEGAAHFPEACPAGAGAASKPSCSGSA